MWDLGQVVGVLLDPAPMGRAVIRNETDGSVTDYQAGWFVGSESSPPSWYLRFGSTTRLRDEVGTRTFEGRRCVEGHKRLRDQWPVELHLLHPASAFIWGRSMDGWRLTPDVRSDQELAVVRLRPTGDSDEQAQLVVDMKRRLLLAHRQRRTSQAIVDVNLFADPRMNPEKPPRDRSNEAWLAG